MSAENEDEAGSGPDQEISWRPHPCPICSRMSVADYRPFCCKRCADVDLGRWLKGNYAFLGGSAPQNQRGE